MRSGFGLYHGDGQLDDQNLPINNEVGRYSLSAKTIPNLSYPVTPFLNGPGTVSPRDMDRNRKDMYVSQWGFSVQQALPRNFVGTLSYVGSKGTYLLTTSYLNLIDPVTGVRPNANFGQVEYRGNINNSSYQGFVASLQRSFSHGLLVSANYTYSHEIDQDAAGGGDSDFPENPACLACERAAGDFDVRHVLNASTVYDLPFGPGREFLSRPGITSAIFGRWSLTDIVAARTGLPINQSATQSGSGCFSHPSGRKVDWELDQYCGLRSSHRIGVWQRAAECGPRSESLADRSGGRQTHSALRASATPVPGRVLQPVQSRTIRTATGRLVVIDIRADHHYCEHDPNWNRDATRDTVRFASAVLKSFQGCRDAHGATR
jgi:hypothetical protein